MEEVIKVLKELSAFLFVCTTNAPFTHPRRSAKKVAKTLPKSPRESSTVTKGPSTTVSRKPMMEPLMNPPQCLVLVLAVRSPVPLPR
jgi:hypothetical protein